MLPKKRLLCLLIVGSIFISSCNEQEVENIQIDFGYEYFPLAIGQTWIYQTDSITFDPQANNIRIDSVRFKIRETITDTLRDNLNNLIYRIEYAEQRAGNSDWLIKNTYKAYIENNRAIRSEENLDFIKLVFPIKSSETWNGIAFIDPRTRISIAGEPVEVFKGWNSILLGQFDEVQLGSQNFQDVLEVEVANTENTLELRHAKEWYAKGRGLIFQELIILDTQCQFCCNGILSPDCENEAWRDRAERGFILRKVLEN